MNDVTIQESQSRVTGLGHRLQTSKSLQVTEIVLVFAVGAAALLGGLAWFGNSRVASIGCIWAANVAMLGVIYAGLWLRKQGWSHLGLRFDRPNLKAIAIAVAQSLVVFVLAVLAFVAGAILMANLVGMPEPADMSKYDYLRGNLPMTLLALASVYLVSAFAEEVIYRGFMITRMMELGNGSKWASVFAVILSSVVFGLVHSDWGVAGMVQASCMGLALGVSYLMLNRNLSVMILAHAYMDTILILQMYFAAS